MKVLENYSIENSLQIKSLSKFYIELQNKNDFYDLHKFLFKYRKTDNIMDHIDELVELINKNVDTSPDHLYI